MVAGARYRSFSLIIFRYEFNVDFFSCLSPRQFRVIMAINSIYYKRWMCTQMKNYSFFFIGLLVGLAVALNFPVSNDDVYCGLDIEESSKSIYEMEAKSTTDPYEPRLSPSAKSAMEQNVVGNVNRPRYYSTELGMKDKLFVGVLTSEQKMQEATAINRTLAHMVDKIKFFITASEVKNNLSLNNIVGFTDTREILKPFHVLKYIADNFLEEFDYFFLVSDISFVNGRRLVDIVNHVSVSEDVYMGSIKEPDSDYCDLDAGILFSNSVLKKVQENLDWCVRNSYSPEHFENIGRCILHSGNLKCIEVVQGQRLNHIKLKPGWTPDPSMAAMTTAYPIHSPEDIYRIHAYVSRVYLEQSLMELRSLRSQIVQMMPHHPAGYRNSSWPGGLRGEASLNPPPPQSKFDILRWVPFNETHMWLLDDWHTITKMNGADRMDVELILEAAWSFSRNAWPNLEPAGLVEGQRLWDPARSLTYKLLLNFKNSETGQFELHHLEVCKPLGQSRLMPLPYVTESSRVAILLPVLPDAEYEYTDNIAASLQFMMHYEEVCLKKGDKTMLFLVLIYKAEAPSKGPTDFYLKIKNFALDLSEKYKASGSKVTWLSLRLPAIAPSASWSLGWPKPVIRLAALELGAARLARESLILCARPDMEFNTEFLNRVRMNTIMGRQAFSPIPFHLYVRPTDLSAPADNKKPEGAIDVKQSPKAGLLDDRVHDVIAFYRKDFENARRLVDSLTLPRLLTEQDLPVFLDAAASILELGSEPALGVMLQSKQIHVLRAAEPGMVIKRLEKLPCKKSHPCLSNFEKEGFSGLNLGTRSNLAKLAFEHEL